MNLEFLPDELLLDLFDYFNGIELIIAFDGLNSRFNFLLYNQFQGYRFNFNRVSKRNFDTVCQQHFPLIVGRVMALNLFNCEETPEQINLFFSYIPSLNQFTRLRALSLSNVPSYDILMKILDECHHLYNLTHLKFGFFYLRNDQAYFQLIVNNIWDLPKLTHCKFVIGGQHFFCAPTILASSIERLSMIVSKAKLNEITRLFEHTPRLKYLLISVVSFIVDDYIPSPLLTLIELNICIFNMSDISKLVLFLQNTPNLHCLDISLPSHLIDGYVWQNIIGNYLTKLKVFRLHMSYTLPLQQNLEERVNELINSFRSSFWIEEHQWFVRYRTRYRTISLSTLSKRFNYDERKFPGSFKTTDPQDDQQEFYNNMTNIDAETFFDQSFPSHIRLPNIISLSTKLPINDHFWSIVPNLNRLITLRVSFHIDHFQSQLQPLLDRAPCLYRLVIDQVSSLPLRISLFKCTNASVRELALRYCNHSFNDKECMALTRSPLGIQCEHLHIMVNNRESIIYLLKNMINLRSLYFICRNEIYRKELASTENDEKFREKITANRDELVQWLKYRLSSTCLVVKDPHTISDILIWI